MTRHPGLFDRLPAVHRERDADPANAGQLAAFVGLMDEVLAALDADIDTLYHDLFIETCRDWMIPYIGDLLGVSHLKGDPWTLRADVARTVAQRRRRGTLAVMESLAFTLTGWAAHAVELRERMLWTQHLNHQRPDRGGVPPQSLPRHIADPVRHGTVTLRDPGVLSFLGTPFDPFARTADVRPTEGVHPRPNLPNLALFLWRLRDFQPPVGQPVHVATVAQAAPGPDDAPFAARWLLDPLGRPMQLFNTFRFDPDADPPELSVPDRTPGPMPPARLLDGPPTGNAAEYVAVDIYAGGRPADPGAGAVGLVLHLPETVFAASAWTTRGANLCAWEAGLVPPLRRREIAVDPRRGRVVLGIEDDASEGQALRRRLRISATYGFPGPSGAHPVARAATPALWLDRAPERVPATAHPGGASLRLALTGLASPGPPRIVEITDSMTHRLDLAAIADIGDEGGQPALTLARPVWIRARSDQRPVIELRQPLRLRPLAVIGAEAEVRALDVRIEGVLMTLAGAPVAGRAIIEQAAVNSLTLDGVTLDPAGHVALDGTPGGTRQPTQTAFRLDRSFGFTDPEEAAAFEPEPDIVLMRCVAGPIAMADTFALSLTDSLVDGGAGVGDAAPGFALSADADEEAAYGPRLTFAGATMLGRSRVTAADGAGGVFVHDLQARDHQSGCLHESWFGGADNRLPPHHACLFGTEASLAFAATVFGRPGYGQLARGRTDPRVLEGGPGTDEMGAYGYLLNTHRWKNLSIRLREFTPVGIRPVLATVT
ncbi:MAG TPA: hypothetical protein VD813_12195 [Pseudonocardia sp.]|nr:hypothetical protein [Pseudonocardia sp.]